MGRWWNFVHDPGLISVPSAVARCFLRKLDIIEIVCGIGMCEFWFVVVAVFLKCLTHEDTIDWSGRQTPDCGKDCSPGCASTTVPSLQLEGMELVRRQRDNP